LIVVPVIMSCGAPKISANTKEVPPPVGAQEHRTKASFKTSAGTAYVGLLVTNVAGEWTTPSQYCLEDGFLYKGANYRLGRTNVFVSGTVPQKALNGAAIVYGKRIKGMDRKIVKLGPCSPTNDEPMPQMRSDWISDEADWRGHTTRARLADTEYIEATAVHPLPIVSEAPTSDPSTIALTVTNTFDRPLSADVEFSLYYEGGAGKPMPKFEPQALGELAPGESKTVLAPKPQRTPKKPKNTKWMFRGYRFKGNVGEVELNLLVTL
jgi:hypothetical protein